MPRPHPSMRSYEMQCKRSGCMKNASQECNNDPLRADLTSPSRRQSGVSPLDHSTAAGNPWTWLNSPSDSRFYDTGTCHPGFLGKGGHLSQGY